jgi:hypothetical protein
MTVDIQFASADNGKTHEFSCTVPVAFKEKFGKIYEEKSKTQDMMVVDDTIKKVNSDSGNMISDYEYAILGDTDCSIGVVFKHLFKSLKEPRYYAKCKVRLADDKIMVKITDKVQCPISIPTGTIRVPVTSVIADCTDCEGDASKSKLSIRFETTKPKLDMPNFDSVITFLTEGLYEAFEEADGYDGA